MRNNFISKYRFLFLSVFIAFILVFLNIGDKSLYLDEVASIAITDSLHSLPTKLWLYEGNSWFFYILFFFWSRISINEIWIRIFAVIWGVLTIFPLYYLAKKIFSKNTADLTVLLLPFNVFFIKTSQFARGYSLLLFLTTLSSLIFIYLLNKHSRIKLFLYLIVNVFAVYTHLFALFVIASHILYLLILRQKNSLINYLITYFGIFLLVVPILVSPAMRSGQIDWITNPGLFSLGSTFVLLTGDFLPLSALILFLLASVIYLKGSQIFRNNRVRFILLSILFPILTSYIFSFLVKPIYNLQYFIIVLPFVSILIAYIITLINNRKLTTFILIVSITGFIFRLYYWYGSLNETGLSLFTLDNNYPDWKQVIEYLDHNSIDKDTVIIVPAYTHISFDYYKNKISRTQIEQMTLQPNPLASGVYTKLNIDQIKYLSQKTNRIWFIKNPRGNTINYENIVVNHLNQNFKLVQNKDYYLINIKLYEKK